MHFCTYLSNFQISNTPFDRSIFVQLYIFGPRK